MFYKLKYLFLSVSVLLFISLNLYSNMDFFYKNKVELMNCVKKKLENGLSLFENEVILHTSPHPDDVTLGYLPYINRLLKNSDNDHYFLTMTSGSNAVRNSDLMSILDNIESNLLENKKNKPLEDKVLKDLLNLLSASSDKSLVLTKIKDLKEDLILNRDSLDKKILKGAIREFEEESVWNSFGITKENIIHFRAKFYFEKVTNFDSDVDRFYKLLLKINPDVLTLTVDPKGIGPATHYKTFLVIQEAVNKFYKKTKKDITIIGYRNVWHQFSLEEANMFIPVTEYDFKILNDTFLNCYKTQVDAMFPNSMYKGNFAQIASAIMKENLSKIEPVLEKNYFDKDVQGLCFLKKISINDLLDSNSLVHPHDELGVADLNMSQV